MCQKKREFCLSPTIAKITCVPRLQLISYIYPSTSTPVSKTVPLLPNRRFIYLRAAACLWVLGPTYAAGVRKTVPALMCSVTPSLTTVPTPPPLYYFLSRQAFLLFLKLAKPVRGFRREEHWKPQALCKAEFTFSARSSLLTSQRWAAWLSCHRPEPNIWVQVPVPLLVILVELLDPLCLLPEDE